MAFIQESEWWRGEILGVVVGFCAERKRKGSEIKAVDAKNNKIVFFSRFLPSCGTRRLPEDGEGEEAGISSARGKGITSREGDSLLFSRVRSDAA